MEPKYHHNKFWYAEYFDKAFISIWEFKDCSVQYFKTNICVLEKFYYTGKNHTNQKELSGLDLPGKGKVGISLVLLGSGNSGKEPASILFERDPEDNGKGKVGISLVLLDSGNSGKEPAFILFERDPEDSLDCVCGQCLVGSPEGFLDRISGQTSVNRILILLTINISNWMFLEKTKYILEYIAHWFFWVIIFEGLSIKYSYFFFAGSLCDIVCLQCL